MNASLVAIYMNPDSETDLGLLEQLVCGGGFQTKNQQNGKVTLIDEEGGFLVADASVLAARIRRNEDTSFQFWESSWSGKHPGDLYCRVQFKPEAVVIEFGELPRESNALLKGLWEQCCRLLDEDKMIGVVVDRSGATEEHADWDAFFSRQGDLDGPCPDLLCVRRGHGVRVTLDCEMYRRETRGNYVIVVEDGLARMLSLADNAPYAAPRSFVGRRQTRRGGEEER